LSKRRSCNFWNCFSYKAGGLPGNKNYCSILAKTVQRSEFLPKNLCPLHFDAD
jgi:hypothetical protein